MTKKLHITSDSPTELKEITSVGQQYVDTVQIYKAKADAGTLTMSDLENLTRQNNLLASQFPASMASTASTPVLINDVNELDRLAKSRAEESANLLKKEGGPVMSLDSLEDLENMAQSSPHMIATMLTAEARRKRGGDNEGLYPGDDLDETITPNLQHDFKLDLISENLMDIQNLLYQAKLCYFQLPYEWMKAGSFEEELHLKATAFQGYGEDGFKLLEAILLEEIEDEDLLEKKAEAAFILASITNKNGNKLDNLLHIWREDTDLEKSVLQALKYCQNPELADWLRCRFPIEQPEYKASLVKVTAYQQLQESDWLTSLPMEKPEVQTEMGIALTLSGNPVDESIVANLIVDNSTEYFTRAILLSVMNGHQDAINTAKKQLIESQDEPSELPLYLACSGDQSALRVLLDCLEKDDDKQSTVYALGILGLTEAISPLVDCFTDTISSKEEWELQMQVFDTLNLITGAQLEVPYPDITPGPKDKEYDISVNVSFKDIWWDWWKNNKAHFDETDRYRRGKPFDLGSCLVEMAFKKGNYWSRQTSFYELVIRSGQKVALFHADWPVQQQLTAIDQWIKWYTDSKERFGTHQWLFNGQPL